MLFIGILPNVTCCDMCCADSHALCLLHCADELHQALGTECMRAAYLFVLQSTCIPGSTLYVLKLLKFGTKFKCDISL